MLNSRYAGIIPPQTDLRQFTINQVKDDIIGYLKKGKVQHAHKLYLVRLVRHMNINSTYPKFRENIIRAICAELKGEVRRLDRLGRLSRGIQAGMLLEIIQDIEDVLLDNMPELRSDYDFIEFEEL